MVPWGINQPSDRQTERQECAHTLIPRNARIAFAATPRPILAPRVDTPLWSLVSKAGPVTRQVKMTHSFFKGQQLLLQVAGEPDHLSPPEEKGILKMATFTWVILKIEKGSQPFESNFKLP